MAAKVFSLWPEGYRLVAIDAYRDGTGPGVAGRRSLDDYADQVNAVIEPEAYGLLRTRDADAIAQICGLRDRWRAPSARGGGMRPSRSSSTSTTPRLVRSVASRAPRGVSRCPAGPRRPMGRSL
jgi:hypothetical protein